MSQTASSEVKKPPPYLDRIREIFPDLKVKSLHYIKDGLANDSVVVNWEWVCRFPKNTKWSQDSFRREVKVLELVEKRVNIPTPKLEKRGTDYFVYRYISGEALLQHQLKRYTEEEQQSIAEEFAEILRQYHQISADDLRRYGIPQSPVNRTSNTWRQFFRRIEKELMPFMRRHNRVWVKEHFAPVLRNKHWMNYEPKLVNGDLGPYHVLFNEKEKRIVGWMDFGTAGIGDPAGDFACIIYNYGESFLKRVAPVYPEIEEALDRARFWAGTLELEWILGGAKAKKLPYFLVHIGSAKDAKPMGCPL